MTIDWYHFTPWASLGGGVLLTLQKNGRIATVASGFITADDRQKALAQLTQLGKAVAARV